MTRPEVVYPERIHCLRSFIGLLRKGRIARRKRNEILVQTFQELLPPKLHPSRAIENVRDSQSISRILPGFLMDL